MDLSNISVVIIDSVNVTPQNCLNYVVSGLNYHISNKFLYMFLWIVISLMAGYYILGKYRSIDVVKGYFLYMLTCTGIWIIYTLFV